MTRCLVKGCQNTSDQGKFVGALCFPCHEMITTGKVHPANQTFIGVLVRGLKFYADQKNWKEQYRECPSEVDQDCGIRARAALEGMT